MRSGGVSACECVCAGEDEASGFLSMYFGQCEWEINQTVRELDLFMEHYVFEQVGVLCTRAYKYEQSEHTIDRSVFELLLHAIAVVCLQLIQLMQYEWHEVQKQVGVLELYQSPRANPVVKVENFDFMVVKTHVAQDKLVRSRGPQRGDVRGIRKF